jgi:hypothetical protein
MMRFAAQVPRIMARSSATANTHLFQANVVLIDDRLDYVHHHRRN